MYDTIIPSGNEKFDTLRRQLRNHAGSLFRWYQSPPMASDVLTLLDLVDDLVLSKQRCGRRSSKGGSREGPGVAG